MTSRSVGYRTCPICEASCGLALEPDGARAAGARRRARRAVARLPVSEGRGARRAAPRPRPPAHAARARCGRRTARGEPGRGVRRGRAGTTQLYTAGTVDQQPKQIAVMCMFGTSWGHSRARRRPHAVPARARCEPGGVERQPGGRTEPARQARRDPRARRQGGGGRSAAHAHGRARRRVAAVPARHRRLLPVRARARAVRGAARGAGPARAARARARRARSSDARLLARGRRRSVSDSREHDPTHRARAGGGRARGSESLRLLWRYAGLGSFARVTAISIGAFGVALFSQHVFRPESRASGAALVAVGVWLALGVS